MMWLMITIIAGAICEGWLCFVGFGAAWIAFYAFFVFLAAVPVYLIYKYISLSKYKDNKDVAVIRRRILIVLSGLVIMFITGTIVNQIYLRLKD